MNFMRKSKIMDFECGRGELSSRRKSIASLFKRTLQPGEVKVDI